MPEAATTVADPKPSNKVEKLPLRVKTIGTAEHGLRETVMTDDLGNEITVFVDRRSPIYVGMKLRVSGQVTGTECQQIDGVKLFDNDGAPIVILTGLPQ